MRAFDKHATYEERAVPVSGCQSPIADHAWRWDYESLTVWMDFSKAEALCGSNIAKTRYLLGYDPLRSRAIDAFLRRKLLPIYFEPFVDTELPDENVLDVAEIENVAVVWEREQLQCVDHGG